jgi:hypothetical protein
MKMLLKYVPLELGEHRIYVDDLVVFSLTVDNEAQVGEGVPVNMLLRKFKCTHKNELIFL